MLDVEVSGRCEDLESRAAQWDEEIASTEGDYGENEDDEDRWSRAEFTPDDSSEMFETLLDELNEGES